MSTRNVVLSQHQHELVDALVKSGRYRNASEVLRDGLRLLEKREQSDAAKLMALQKVTEQGLSDLSAGHFTDVAEEDPDAFLSELAERAGRAVSAK